MNQSKGVTMDFKIRYRIYQWCFDGFNEYHPCSASETEDEEKANMMFILNLIEGKPCQMIMEMSYYDSYTRNKEESTQVIAECYMGCLEEGKNND